VRPACRCGRSARRRPPPRGTRRASEAPANGCRTAPPAGRRGAGRLTSETCWPRIARMRNSSASTHGGTPAGAPPPAEPAADRLPTASMATDRRRASRRRHAATAAGRRRGPRPGGRRPRPEPSMPWRPGAQRDDAQPAGSRRIRRTPSTTCSTPAGAPRGSRRDHRPPGVAGRAGELSHPHRRRSCRRRRSPLPPAGGAARGRSWSAQRYRPPA
jgi:hypothetical protein